MFADQAGVVVGGDVVQNTDPQGVPVDCRWRGQLFQIGQELLSAFSKSLLPHWSASFLDLFWQTVDG